MAPGYTAINSLSFSGQAHRKSQSSSFVARKALYDLTQQRVGEDEKKEHFFQLKIIYFGDASRVIYASFESCKRGSGMFALCQCLSGARFSCAINLQICEIFTDAR